MQTLTGLLPLAQAGIMVVYQGRETFQVVDQGENT
jgi:hypothetical protein